MPPLRTPSSRNEMNVPLRADARHDRNDPPHIQRLIDRYVLPVLGVLVAVILERAAQERGVFLLACIVAGITSLLLGIRYFRHGQTSLATLAATGAVALAVVAIFLAPSNSVRQLSTVSNGRAGSPEATGTAPSAQATGTAPSPAHSMTTEPSVEPDRTELHIIRVFGLDQSTVREGYQVVGNLEGECVGNSHASNRPDAWRCFSPGSVYDPCFHPSGAADLVGCLAAPWSKDVVLIELTEPLPIPPDFTQEEILAGPPWGVELSSGERCFWAQGGTGRVGGLRINYGCGERAILVGEANRSPQLWRIFYAQDVDADLTEVEIRQAWF
jgi:hypothetical protein